MKKNINDVLYLKERNSIWRKVLHLAVKKNVKKGETWSTGKGDKKAIIFLDSGSANLRSITIKGRERINMLFESGCILGETSVFATTFGNTSSTNIFTANEDCVLYFFPTNLFDDYNFMLEYPELIYNLLEMSSSKIVYLFALLSDRNGEKAKEVICKHIIRLHNKHKSLKFPLGISIKDFVLSTGLHRSTVFRILDELKEEGLIGSFKKKEIEILNLEALEDCIYGDK